MSLMFFSTIMHRTLFTITYQPPKALSIKGYRRFEQNLLKKLACLSQVKSMRLKITELIPGSIFFSLRP